MRRELQDRASSRFRAAAAGLRASRPRSHPQPPPFLQPDEADPLLALEATLRVKGGVPWRSGVVAQRRVEYVRGKDFAAHFASRPNAAAGLASADATPAAAAAFIANALLRRGRLARCGRAFARPKPGMDRVAKWPKRLAVARDQSFEPTDFYAWQHDRPASPWAGLYAILLAVVVLACCCFPLAPHWVKLAVVYLSGALLTVMLGLIGVRAALAAATWAATGKTVWLFPNLLDDDKGFYAAFKPTLAVEDAKSSVAVRAGVSAATVASLIFAARYAPDAATAKEGVAAAHDALLDVLNLNAKRLGNGGGEKGGAGAPAPAAGAGRATATAPPPVVEGEEGKEEEGATHAGGDGERAEL
jgi:translocation protein SEC62